MGDPHCSPYYSKCTQVVGTEEGTFDLWTVPGKISFEVNVYAKAGKKWIRALIKDGKEIFNADNCFDKNPPAPLRKTVTIKDDLGGKVDVYYEVMCRAKAESKGAEQLIVNVRLRDEYDTYQREPDTQMPPATTFMFDKDTGMCVNPPKYGQGIENPTQNDYKLKCNRQSDFKFTSGRYCNCSVSCAAWGDPHLMSFYTEQCRSSQRCNFLTPITQEAQYKLMYSAQQLYALSTDLDEKCKLITEATVFAMKQRSKDKLTGCSSQSGALAMGDLSFVENTKDFPADSWDVLRVKAEDVCSKFGKDATTFVLPSDPAVSTGVKEIDAFNKAHYDPSVRGYALGEQVLVWKDGKQVMVPVSGGMSTCLKKKGFNPDEATMVVNFGGATSTLVCHQNGYGMWYFNTCSNKEGMTVKNFVKNGKELENVNQLPTISAQWNDAMISTLEQAAQTGGFCATGDFNAKQSVALQTTVQANTYQYRGANTVLPFVAANNVNNQ